VKINIHGSSTDIDRRYGSGGLGGYGDIPANREAGGDDSGDKHGSDNHGQGDGPWWKNAQGGNND
jgi:levansucrase